MFSKTRNQLLISYQVVCTIILILFAVVVRLSVGYMLNRQLDSRLATLATAAALELELEGAQVIVDNETLVNDQQVIQWFDTDGTLLSRQGQKKLVIPFNSDQARQTQHRPEPIQTLTIPVDDYAKDIFIGYVRVGESKVSLYRALRSLDWGLGIGVILALGSSTLGSFWLTQKAIRPIEQAFQQLRRFTADASHELRSPLMAIRTNAAVALKYPDAMRPGDAEKLQTILQTAQQMQTIIEDLLLLARLDREVNVEKEELNLADLLRELLMVYQPRFAKKNIALLQDIPSQLAIYGNQSQLIRLFTNLIDNALCFTPAGGMVQVMAQTDQEKIVVQVKDTGVGIADEHIDLIFERFWQMEQARTYHAGRSGLGLAIAQELAHHHRGTIVAISQLGRGSCFTVTLR